MTRSRLIDVTLIVFGLYSVALGIFMMVSPGVFFDTLGAFGVRNDHYIFDNASFELPLGLMLWAALRWRSWRVPALAFAALHWALHALSHGVDTHHHSGTGVGLLEFAGLLVATVALVVALWASIIEQRQPS
ncbi:hypothetical protein [Mycobacterium talmoniae]|uniref:Uncharacterized protein n=1 Tax=Mycobacterium talmoniae TaxID=1858794 RepID=A0A1S1NF69_9MYCO|nr:MULTISPECIES: hypothetical protein [Mycobacterium]OHU99792.1 hypothetical protein BKN37_18880 [Mycobacterium talmoniae]PQM49611.1 hypothetical protein C1Y40_00160 [Mycobacterium talmoniae]TDH48684.1 hypothetical protein E2F47_22945 [Mycobacterium eburneum]